MKISKIKKHTLAIATVTILSASSIAPMTANASFASSDDPSCERTLSELNQEAEKRAALAKDIIEKNTSKSSTFIDQLADCVDQIGGAFDNPFGKPSGNIFDGLLEKLCNKGLDLITSQNPVTKAINGFSISDPSGLFTYDPSVSINKSGKFEENTSVEDNNLPDRAWREIEGRIPSGSSVWN